MTPGEIIAQHRENLIRRIVSRNALLRFAPADRGDRVDVCKIFPEPEPNLLEENVRRIDPNEFLSRIFAMEKVRHPINQTTGNIPRRLRTMVQTCLDHTRTTGQWTLVLAWPFLHVPKRYVEHANKDLFAPLFLWRIRVSVIRGDAALFELFQDDNKSECESNFALAEYLKVRGEIQLPGKADDVVEQLQNPGTPGQKIATIKRWLRDMKIDFSDADGGLKPYIKPTVDALALINVAALGNAHFKYLALFRNLEELENKARDGESLGLLEKLFTTTPPTQAETVEPKLREQYLVETSDPSQEGVVWDARNPDASLVQLKGPPGTGKSQTIVNIVADALYRRERVAVVCDHVAALDVVHKRLKGKNLSGLVAQITSPKENRRAVIQKALAIEDIPIRQASRENWKIIEESEEICNSRTISFAPPGCRPEETRGHCTATIHATQSKTGFDARLDRDGIKDVVRAQLGKETVQKVRETVKEIADKWRNRDYPNHPWKNKVSAEVDADKLQAYFDEIIESIEELDPAHLPAGDALVYAAHPLVVKHYYQMADGQRHSSLKKFAEIVARTREAFAHAGIAPTDCPRLWGRLGQSNEARHEYAKYRDRVGDIPDVRAIKRAIAENAVVDMLVDKFSRNPENWMQIIGACMCQLRLHELSALSGNREPLSLYDYLKAQSRLKQAVDAHKSDNIDMLLRRHYPRRVQARNSLKMGGYLHLTGGGGNPASRLRGLYQTTNIRESTWTMFPVLLANPSSVSDIMPLDLECIDLLIIDEASQMFTADAMPLLYRTKRAVISGDEKQMPPSSFFALSEDEFDDDGDDDDKSPAENIDVPFELLDAVDKRANVVGSLEVHYRSRPAELVNFSNHAFYKGKLQVAGYNGDFPNFLDGHAIRMEHVAGDFHNSTNTQEADAIVRLLKGIVGEKPDWSVGIIVFNTRQRDLVNERLVEEANSDKNFGSKFSELQNLQQDGEEVGLFVRSVEHVQGDERDIIILGTTYGNKNRYYGPIIRTGLGHRRLNVAVTRAKRGMIIATSLDINHISHEIERPDAAGEGAGRERWYLWKYMQYAQAVSDGNDKVATDVLRRVGEGDVTNPVGEKPENEFERQVGEFLKSHGFHVDYQVGVGGFRIDIGVKNNESDSTYICGIECDGRIYHSGWRARQNDIWRQGILEDKGWKIERIWSDEWFRGREKVRQAFLQKVRDADGHQAQPVT